LLNLFFATCRRGAFDTAFFADLRRLLFLMDALRATFGRRDDLPRVDLEAFSDLGRGGSEAFGKLRRSGELHGADVEASGRFRASGILFLRSFRHCSSFAPHS
jgi:hypothetical protein